MKTHKLIALLLAAFFLVPACTKDGSQEEKIRITIDKTDGQKAQEPVQKTEVPTEKP